MAVHRAEYAGQWVALDGDRLIASGATEAEVADVAEVDGAYLPLIGYIPHPDEPTFIADTLAFEISYLYADSTEGIAIPVVLASANGIYNKWGKIDPEPKFACSVMRQDCVWDWMWNVASQRL
jgi:uncharacterized protein DUF5678